jgi:hypothetical protein
MYIYVYICVNIHKALLRRYQDSIKALSRRHVDEHVVDTNVVHVNVGAMRVCVCVCVYVYVYVYIRPHTLVAEGRIH